MARIEKFFDPEEYMDQPVGIITGDWLKGVFGSSRQPDLHFFAPPEKSVEVGSSEWKCLIHTWMRRIGCHFSTIKEDEGFGIETSFYDKLTDEIVMVDLDQFEDPSIWMDTCLHESIHATGFESRLNRDMGTYGSREYMGEEIVAEIGAILLTQRLNQTPAWEYAAWYLREFVQHMNVSRDAIPHELAFHAIRSRKAVDWLWDKCGPLLPLRRGESI